MSRAGKEVLIKAVAQAIPTFAMGCFDITKEIRSDITKEMCEQISTMICRYWWSSQDKENKMHWIKWETLTQPKKEGRLGFRDIHTFNLAMLAKQGWRLLQNPDSLCAQVLRAKHFQAGNVLEAKSCSGASYTWRSIQKGLQVLRNCMIWRIGNGRSVNIWRDPWIPREWSRKPMTPKGNNLVSKVDELIDPATGVWEAN